MPHRAMAPSPGTPVGGGEAPAAKRLASLASGAAGADASGGGMAAAAAPASPMEVEGADRASGRVYCPVATCPCSDASRAQGWQSVATMKDHVDAHLSGALQGDVPAAWLQAHGRQRCLVCGLSVSTRHGIHPTCRPMARAAVAPAGAPRGSHVIAPLPSFDEIQSGQTPTLRHVPKAARHTWGQALTRCLASVVYHNDATSWQELLMLPKCVLDAPRRGGRQHQTAVASYTLDRLQRWQAGERQSLWDTCGQLSGSRRRDHSARERQEMAVSLAREGFDRKACVALLSSGLCPDTPATVQALRDLHPQHSQPVGPAVHELPVAPELTPDMVAKALRSFPADTAPGPSGLRVQHLREATVAGEADLLLQHLASVVGLLAQGQACPAAAAAFAGASLIALPKPNGGVRSIAIGETLRRLIAKCLLGEVRQRAREYFWPAQVGVAVPGGGEVAVHTTRSWVERHARQADKVLLKLDFKNAFNEVSRQAVLDTAQAQFPALARWVTWCYQAPASLYFGRGTIIPSAAGVQQGDPFGPLLFAAAIQPLAAQLRASLPFSVFYLDDGVIAGDIASVSQALAAIQQQAASLGVTLNLDKCELIAVGPTSPAALARNFPRQLVTDADGHSRVLRNFELLGAALGDNDFIAEHTQQRVRAGKQLLDAIASLEDPQVGLRLLRPVRGIAALCTAYVATLLLPNVRHSLTSTRRCGRASAVSLACT